MSLRMVRVIAGERNVRRLTSSTVNRPVIASAVSTTCSMRSRFLARCGDEQNGQSCTGAVAGMGYAASFRSERQALCVVCTAYRAASSEWSSALMGLSSPLAAASGSQL